MKKFELTSEFVTFLGKKLFRIRALIEFGDVKAGELGGYIEKEENLDHGGNAWVYGNAEVYGDAKVYGNAQVSGNAEVYGDAKVYSNAKVSGNAKVYSNAKVSGNAQVSGNAWVYGNAEVYGNAQVSGNAEVYGDAKVYGNAKVSGNAQVSGDADYAYAHGFGSEYRTTTFFRLRNGDVGVRCGCFYGTLQEFRDKVRATHKETKKAKEYLMLADLMKLRFAKE